MTTKEFTSKVLEMVSQLPEGECLTFDQVASILDRQPTQAQAKALIDILQKENSCIDTFYQHIKKLSPIWMLLFKLVG